MCYPLPNLFPRRVAIIEYTELDQQIHWGPDALTVQRVTLTTDYHLEYRGRLKPQELFESLSLFWYEGRRFQDGLEHTTSDESESACT